MIDSAVNSGVFDKKCPLSIPAILQSKISGL
jgi:hypothetical protein